MCNHQFIRSDSINKGAADTQRGIPGVAVICALCGEVRHIFEDGTVNVVREGYGK